MIRVLVTGGRLFTDYKFIEAWILYIHHTVGIEVLIHGGAAGADSFSALCCERHGIPVLRFPALWHIHGLSAGPVRNTQMLDEGLPDILLAFPGGPGTSNMIKQSTERGLPVLKASDEEIPDEFWKTLDHFRQASQQANED